MVEHLPQPLAPQDGQSHRSSEQARPQPRDSGKEEPVQEETGTLKPLRLRKVLLAAWDMQGGSLMSLSETGQAAIPRGQGAN